MVSDAAQKCAAVKLTGSVALAPWHIAVHTASIIRSVAVNVDFYVVLHAAGAGVVEVLVTVADGSSDG